MATERADIPDKHVLVDKDRRVGSAWRLFFNTLLQVSYAAYDGLSAFNRSRLTASTTYNPPNIAASAWTSTALSIPGVLAGDYAKASFTPGNAGVQVLATVPAANTVVVTFWNISGGAIDLGSGTLRVLVEHPS